jgi:hypothetical protein
MLPQPEPFPPDPGEFIRLHDSLQQQVRTLERRLAPLPRHPASTRALPRTTRQSQELVRLRKLSEQFCAERHRRHLISDLIGVEDFNEFFISIPPLYPVIDTTTPVSAHPDRVVSSDHNLSFAADHQISAPNVTSALRRRHKVPRTARSVRSRRSPPRRTSRFVRGRSRQHHQRRLVYLRHLTSVLTSRQLRRLLSRCNTRNVRSRQLPPARRTSRFVRGRCANITRQRHLAHLVYSRTFINLSNSKLCHHHNDPATRRLTLWSDPTSRSLNSVSVPTLDFG